MAEQNANNVNITGGSITGVSGFGDVTGPASSTDNAIARFDSTTGKLLQNSVVTVGDTGAVAGVTTLAASTSVTTPIVQATNSAGLALKNSAGTAQISMGAGGGDNVTIAVATNINGANAQIDISPTGTGHVHIKPTGVNSVEIAPTFVGEMDNVTIGAATPAAGTFTLISSTRINPRAVAAGSTSGTITPNGNTTDVFNAFGLTGAITVDTPSGTPVDGQRLMLRFEDNGTGRGITWTGTSGAYRAVGVTLPTTTVASKVTYVGCVYNSTDVFWDAIAVANQA
jgi:hypothetical protein